VSQDNARNANWHGFFGGSTLDFDYNSNTYKVKPTDGGEGRNCDDDWQLKI